ncbi:sensor histidine kinase [Pseudonocardia acidicola]|uniref:histidine kinase n=1 Tax=Pseudonocardia acidicola TaxID=2724939 RepID=A0ABX1SEI9_9PSEU|nr:sensor histidine kinase [Pseudonocardia acidicola]NMH99983.1 sensor histidine kinase [Pseudonocardia acidicola]
MGLLRDRRPETGRLHPDPENADALRGLLHDLGRDLVTLLYVVESMRDAELDDVTCNRIDLLEHELERVVAMVHLTDTTRPDPGVVSVRPLLEQITSLTTVSAQTQVSLSSADDLRMRIDETVLWRMVSNLVDNAVRAAGPRGRVEVTATGGPDVVIEVADNGPGFGRGRAGTAGLGLDIVAGLVQGCGGSLRMREAQPRGTRAQLLFPGTGIAADGRSPVGGR